VTVQYTIVANAANKRGISCTLACNLDSELTTKSNADMRIQGLRKMESFCLSLIFADNLNVTVTCRHYRDSTWGLYIEDGDIVQSKFVPTVMEDSKKLTQNIDDVHLLLLEKCKERQGIQHYRPFRLTFIAIVDLCMKTKLLERGLLDHLDRNIYVCTTRESSLSHPMEPLLLTNDILQLRFGNSGSKCFSCQPCPSLLFICKSESD
jgi:hypothetical protein